MVLAEFRYVLGNINNTKLIFAGSPSPVIILLKLCFPDIESIMKIIFSLKCYTSQSHDCHEVRIYLWGTEEIEGSIQIHGKLKYDCCFNA